MNRYKLISCLLIYPDAELQQELAELGTAAEIRDDVAELVRWIAESDIYAVQERYVELFDRTRSLSLHLFEHVYGEGKERGQALLALRERYEAHGLEPSAEELPDYLPMYLEYLSQLSPAEARRELAQAAPVLTVLKQRLEKRGSSYAALFAALEELAGVESSAEEIDRLAINEDDDPNNPASVDAAWREAPVEFGAGSSLSGAPEAQTGTGGRAC